MSVYALDRKKTHICVLLCFHHVSIMSACTLIRIFVQEGLDFVTMVSITQSFGLNDFELRVLLIKTLQSFSGFIV